MTGGGHTTAGHDRVVTVGGHHTAGQLVQIWHVGTGGHSGHGGGAGQGGGVGQGLYVVTVVVNVL